MKIHVISRNGNTRIFVDDKELEHVESVAFRHSVVTPIDPPTVTVRLAIAADDVLIVEGDIETNIVGAG